MAGTEAPKHPLLLPDILEFVFNKLGVIDLKTCRQVNRVWHEAATVAIRQASTVKIELERKDEKKILNFLELVQSDESTFSNLPFAQNYCMENVSLDYPEFWTFCGNSIKSLQLSSISFDSPYVFRNIIQSCPNLKSLQLSFIEVAFTCSRDNEQPSVLVPRFLPNTNLTRLDFKHIRLGDISFVELFRYFPSLEELDANYCSDASRIFQALATCREQDPQSWRIKNIKFNFEYVREPRSDLRFLWNDNPSLETLSVKYSPFSDRMNSDNQTTIGNILSANATTLKSLNLYGPKAAVIFDSPYKTVLKKVVDFTLSSAHITSLSFLRYFPNLKKLELSLRKLNLHPEAEMLNHWILSSCTQLTVKFRATSAFDLVPLFRRLPNVEKLKVNHCTNEMFARICDIYPNLVCLELLHSLVDDCGISGLDEEDVARINEDGNLDRRSVTVPRPNLSCLRNLKWFRYDAKDPTENLLGWCAALCGVQQLPQLQHLDVDGDLLPIWDRLYDQFPWRNP